MSTREFVTVQSPGFHHDILKLTADDMGIAEWQLLTPEQADLVLSQDDAWLSALEAIAKAQLWSRAF